MKKSKSEGVLQLTRQVLFKQLVDHIAAAVFIAKIEENIPENRKILRESLNRRRTCLEQTSSAMNVTGNEVEGDFIASNRMLTCPSPLLMGER